MVCILSGFLSVWLSRFVPVPVPIHDLFSFFFFLATANVWTDSFTVAKSSALSAGAIGMAPWCGG